MPPGSWSGLPRFEGKSLKILHIISQTPDFTGSGKYLREVVRQSALNGHENFLVAGIQGDFKMPGDLVPEDACRSVAFAGKDIAWPIAGMSDVMPYPSTRFSSLSPADLRRYRSAFREKIRQALDLFRPDILHTHHLWVVSALARSMAPHLPMVTTCHGTCLRQHHLCPETGRSIRSDLSRIDRVIALSRGQKKIIEESLGIDPGRITVISGGYNKDCFFYQPKSFQGVVELLYAGKLSSFKGVPWLLKSLDRIRELPFRLHMAGSSTGRELENCLALAQNLGSKVVYHGPLSHEALGDLMRRCHVFVLPSFFEGLPLVLMEALACGCRIITTALPGVREILGHDLGDMVSFIDLPALKTIDTPHEKDLPFLEAVLSQTLSQAILSVEKGMEPDLEQIQRAVAPYTWEALFKRMQAVFQESAVK